MVRFGSCTAWRFTTRVLLYLTFKLNLTLRSFDAVPTKNFVATTEPAPQHQANPQERTPEPTLTQTDAAVLQEQVLKDHFLKAFGASSSNGPHEWKVEHTFLPAPRVVIARDILKNVGFLSMIFYECTL
jgi:hypothetical protein